MAIELTKANFVKKVEKPISQLFTISQRAEAANSVKIGAKMLGREKLFPVIDKILRVTGEDADFNAQPLRIINDELIKAGETFAAWTPKQIKALKSLKQCKNILKFLKENIKGRSGLNDFYDNATISAGETDIEVGRVSDFYQSVTGYAPLILDLQVQTCSFEGFIRACKSVFDALERDPLIDERLIESSNENFEWIKACNDQQGSVEQSSLKMAQKFNKTGIYTISRFKNRSTNEKMCENFLKITYQKVVSESKDEKQSLTLEELQELRSKLMLIKIGIEGKKDVDRFVRVLNLVEVVTKHFISLIDAGCHLFSQWVLQVIIKIKIINFTNIL